MLERESVNDLVEGLKDACYGPGGDPYGDSLWPAARIVKVLLREGYGQEIPIDCIRVLKYANAGNEDFLYNVTLPDYLANYQQADDDI